MNLQRRARPLPDATLPRAVLRTACPALDAAKRNLHRLFTRALGRRRGGSPRRSFSAIDEGRAAGSVWASPFPLPLGAFWDAGPAFARSESRWSDWALARTPYLHTERIHCIYLRVELNDEGRAVRSTSGRADATRASR
jgi:hypothetical protein